MPIDWGGLATAGLGALGGALGSSGSGRIRYRTPRFIRQNIRDYRDTAEDLYTNPENWAQYPEAMPIGPMSPYEAAALEGYGGLGEAALTLGDLYTGGILGGMNNPYLSGYAGGFSGAPDLWNAAASGGVPQVSAGQVGGAGIDPNLGLFGSTAGINANPNAALRNAMSGNISPYMDALDASFSALDRNFNERTLPALQTLDDQYTGGQGGSGGLKIGQRMLQDLNQRKGEIGAQFAYNATTDALNRQLQGANVASSALLSQSGQDLQGAGLGMDLGRINAALLEGDRNAALTADLSNQGALFNYMNALQMGAGRGAQASSSLANTDLGFLSQLPNAYNVYAGAPNAFGSAGQLFRGITDPLFANEFAREQYTNNLPFMMNQGYGGTLQNLFGMAGGSVQQPSANPWQQALLGGISGYLNYTPPPNVPTINTQPTGNYGALVGAGRNDPLWR